MKRSEYERLMDILGERKIECFKWTNIAKDLLKNYNLNESQVYIIGQKMKENLKNEYYWLRYTIMTNFENKLEED